MTLVAQAFTYFSFLIFSIKVKLYVPTFAIISFGFKIHFMINSGSITTSIDGTINNFSNMASGYTNNSTLTKSLNMLDGMEKGAHLMDGYSVPMFLASYSKKFIQEKTIGKAPRDPFSKYFTCILTENDLKTTKFDNKTACIIKLNVAQKPVYVGVTQYFLDHYLGKKNKFKKLDEYCKTPSKDNKDHYKTHSKDNKDQECIKSWYIEDDEKFGKKIYDITQLDNIPTDVKSNSSQSTIKPEDNRSNVKKVIERKIILWFLFLQKTMLERQLNEVKTKYKNLLNSFYNSDLISKAKDYISSYTYVLPVNKIGSIGLSGIKSAIKK